MTIQEIYELIKQKKENAVRDKIAMWNCINQSKLDEVTKEHYLGKEQRLIGEIDAYTDVLCLIESSGVLDDRQRKENRIHF